jgi:hypothetical protein
VCQHPEKRTTARRKKTNEMSDEGLDLESRVRGLLEEVTRRLGPERVQLTVEPPGRYHGPIFTLTPRNPNAARVTVHVGDENEVELTLGEAAHFELWLPRRKAPELLPLLERIVGAVVEGRFEETVWFLGENAVRSEGRVQLEDRTERIHYRNLFPSLVPWKKRSQRSYEAY